MHTHPDLLYDMPIWTLYIAAGCYGIVWILVGLLIILLEAVTLRLLNWGTFKRSLADAVLMNLASTLVGCAVPILLVATDNIPQSLVGLAIGWVLSIGIEGGALTLVNTRRQTEQHPASDIWRASALANSASYVMIGTLVLLYSFARS